MVPNMAPDKLENGAQCSLTSLIACFLYLNLATTNLLLGLYVA